MDQLQDPQYKTPDGSALRIWRDTAQNNFLSEKLGRPVFDDVLYVEVISPGSRDSTPIFECVRNFAKEMEHPAPLYGARYDAFKEFIKDFEKNEESDASLAGTPLSQWPEMTRIMAASLKAANIFTVDALASLPDTKLPVVGPDGRTWREKAKVFIESAANSGYATALAAELDRTKADLAASNAQLAEMSKQIEALQASQAGGKAAKATKTPEAAPEAPAPAPVAEEPAPATPATDTVLAPII